MTDLIPDEGRATLDIADVARILGVARSTLYEIIRRGEFPVPVIALGSRRVVSRVLLERYLAGELR